MLLGLDFAIWIVIVLYFIGMLVLGWWSKKGIVDREGFLLGGRQFGIAYMVMHAFGAGTHPGDVAGVTSKTVERGGSGIWVSWMWMFGTPFYWLIAPILRRMRCLTVADYFEERFGRAAAALYVVVAMVGMTVATASILQATTRTVQGMMGKATVIGEATLTRAAGAVDAEAEAPGAAGEAAAPAAAERPAWEARGVATEEEEFGWFVGILLVMTAVFVVYSFWGGIVAAVKTDMAQGLMIIALSFVAIPAALSLAGGWDEVVATLSAHSTPTDDYLALFDPQYFSLLAVVVLCINAPFSMMAQPHVMSVSAAGRTEWEGRVGFTYGNILKRICTMGWCVLGLAWLAFLIDKGTTVHADAAFGDSVRYLLHPVLQGLMLACVMAAAMSSGDALQVTIAGLFSQNIYRQYIRKDASERHYVLVTRLAGVVVIAGAVVCAILMRKSVVQTILAYFKLTATVGVSIVMGILWRRMNTTGVFTSTILAAGTFIVTRYVLGLGQAATTGLPLAAGAVGGVIGSLLARPPRPEQTDPFFKKIYTPIGQEDRLQLPLDEAVPSENRLVTAGGLFIVKPTRQSWVGFLLTLAICLALLGLMWVLLA
ncbi:MAG: hypothetical protein R6X20_03205 [Phycisphaerae bacterium]